MKNKLLLVICGIIPILVVFCDMGPLDPPHSDITIGTINDLKAQYEPAQGKAVLQWTRPAGAVAGYYVYRTNKLVNNVPVDFEKRNVRVDSTATEYRDQTSPDNGTLYYVVTPIVKNNHQLIEGRFSNVASCQIAVRVMFNIEDGAIFTATDKCSLTIIDHTNNVAGVRFSNTANTFTGGMLPPPVNKMRQYGWELQKGAGKKVVYAEITYNGGAKEILSDDIGIQPYRIEFKLRNLTDRANKEMRVFDGEGEMVAVDNKLYTDYRVFIPSIDFSITTFNDATLSRDFTYWIVLPEKNAQFKKAKTESKWIKSGPKNVSLTGIGKNHNDQHIYNFRFKPGKAQNDPNSIDAQNLKSFFPGANLPVGKMFDSLKTIGPGDDLLGRKEFAIMAKFKGRFFDDERIVYSSPEIQGEIDGSFVASFDFFPPAIYRKKFDYLEDPGLVHEDGDKIDKSFSLKVMSCEDMGGANIKSIELLVSPMPDSLYAKWKPGHRDMVSIANEITLSQLTSGRHYRIPIAVPDDRTVSNTVQWDNIDISRWPSGPYLFAYVTEDEFGNRGIAPYSMQRPNYSPIHPFHLQILSGKKEL